MKKITTNQVKNFIKNDLVGSLTHALTMSALINEEGEMGNEVSEGVLTLRGYQRLNKDIYIVMESEEDTHLRDLGYLFNSLYNNCLKAHYKKINNLFFIVKMKGVIRTIRIPSLMIVKYIEGTIKQEKFVRHWGVKDLRRKSGRT